MHVMRMCAISNCDLYVFFACRVQKHFERSLSAFSAIVRALHPTFNISVNFVSFFIFELCAQYRKGDRAHLMDACYTVELCALVDHALEWFREFN